MTKLGPLPPVPGVTKFEFHGSLFGPPVVNIFHVQYGGGPPSATDLATHASRMHDSFQQVFQSLLSTAYNATGTTATDLSSSTGAVATQGGPWTGTGGSDYLPNNTAMLINWSIPRRYRGGHPRTYLPGLTLSDTSGPTSWTPAVVSSFSAAAENFLSRVNAPAIGAYGPFSMVCVHYYHLGAYRVPPLVDPVTAGAAHGMPASMRKRMS